MENLFAFDLDKSYRVFLRVLNVSKIIEIQCFDLETNEGYARVVMEGDVEVRMGLLDYGRLLAHMTRK